MAHKLNFKLADSPRKVEGDGENCDYWDVVWSHVDGPVKDTHLRPINHPPIDKDDPPIQYKEFPAGTRKEIKDQISCKEKTPKSTVMQMCEEKRARLAQAIGMECCAMCSKEFPVEKK